MVLRALISSPALLAASLLLSLPAGPAFAQNSAPAAKPAARQSQPATKNSPPPAQSASPQHPSSPSHVAPAPPPIVPGAIPLDHVVASVDSSVILQSDVEEEMRFSALEPIRVLPGHNTPDRALRRLIDRTLILQQMKDQQLSVTTAAAAVTKAVDQLRKEIPACSRFHCETTKGWDSFLQDHDLTPAMVQQRWSQRMAILRFVDLRFRAGIRISQEQIQTYYDKVLVPALTKRHDSAPALSAVSTRIREVLLQQQVSGLFQDWLSSLRGQGNVRIVDPQYFALDQAIEAGEQQEEQNQ